jgi:hypothetical protein
VIPIGFGGKAAFAGRPGNAVRGNEIAESGRRPDESAFFGSGNVFLPGAVDEQTHDCLHLSDQFNLIIIGVGDRASERPDEYGWTFVE